MTVPNEMFHLDNPYPNPTQVSLNSMKHTICENIINMHLSQSSEPP